MAEWHGMYFVTIFIYWIVTILVQIINSYMSLIMDRWMDVYILGNFFYTKLSISGYQGVHSWTGAVEFFHKRDVMFPILYKITCAWLLWKWDFTISLHDSLSNNITKCMDIIKEYLLLTGGWTQHYHTELEQGSFRSTTAGQFNDCGVFLCMNACNIGEQQSFKFYKDVIRAKNVIIKKKLLNWKLLHLYFKLNCMILQWITQPKYTHWLIAIIQFSL